MDSDALIASLRQAVPGAELEGVRSVDLHATIYARREAVPAVARALRDAPGLQFDVLTELTCVDLYPREPRFELVYMLVSTRARRRARVKVRLPASDARIDTASGIWPAANWLEREVWDLFGIVFDGHPDPRRLLMPEDWEGFPLRKDYPVQIRKTPTAAEPLQVTAEEFRASVTRDRLTRR